MSKPRLARSLQTLALGVLLSFPALAQAAPAGPTLTYALTGNWTTGFQTSLIVTNGTATAITNWSLAFDYAPLITSMWDALIVTHTGNHWTISGPTWDPSLAAGASHTFGFVGNPNGNTLVDPTNCTLSGAPCIVNGNPASAGGGTAPPSGGGGGSTPPPCTGTSSFTVPPVGGFAAGSKRIVGYYTAWSVYARNYHVPSIPAAQLTHVNYAFATIGSAGTIELGDSYADIDRFYPGDSWNAGALRGSFHQLQILKAQYPHLKTLISVGGWTWSGNFSDAALTAQSRQTFAQSCAQFVAQYGFDGVDIDWEYPVSGGLPGNTTRPADAQNYTLLLAALRSALTAQGAANGHQYLLTIAAPAGPANFANVQLAQVAPYVDWMNLMAYDFHGGWESTTGFNSPLYSNPGDPSPDPVIATQFNTDSAVQAYLAAGVPANKLVVGNAFYGRGWAGVPNVNGGLYQSSTGLPTGTWEAGVFDYADLVAHYIPTYTRHWSAQAQTPWLYNPSTGIMISYDDPQSIGVRAQYINGLNLGGGMFWELSCDDAQHSLLTALQQPLTTPQLWLQAATTGNGMGDLYLRAGGAPSASTHVLVAASATLAPGGPGTGPAASGGLIADALFSWCVAIPPAPFGTTHYDLAHDPYTTSAWILPPCSLPGLAGQHWEIRAAAYSTLTGNLTSLSNVCSLAF